MAAGFAAVDPGSAISGVCSLTALLELGPLPASGELGACWLACSATCGAACTAPARRLLKHTLLLHLRMLSGLCREQSTSATPRLSGTIPD
jgi:hypothetical protein